MVPSEIAAAWLGCTHDNAPKGDTTARLQWSASGDGSAAVQLTSSGNNVYTGRVSVPADVQVKLAMTDLALCSWHPSTWAVVVTGVRINGTSVNLATGMFRVSPSGIVAS